MCLSVMYIDFTILINYLLYLHVSLGHLDEFCDNSSKLGHVHCLFVLL